MWALRVAMRNLTDLRVVSLVCVATMCSLDGVSMCVCEVITSQTLRVSGYECITLETANLDHSQTIL
jgi:hypothetical protein